jgi:hypothetical protein
MNEYIMNTCKLGQGSKCCRYLIAGPNGFECAKQHIGMKNYLDMRVAADDMNAKGDNCIGREPNTLIT